jgi:hypothetical protein
MGQLQFGIPKNNLINIIKGADIQYPLFIETGTYHGKTSAWASQVFDHVETIEIATSLFEKAQFEYKNISNIRFNLGDSSIVLNEILQRQQEPAVFWLDGHWCGGESGGQEQECPILKEIATIRTHAHSESIILIDDARLFLAPPPLPHSTDKWPDIGEVIRWLCAFDSKCEIRIFDDVIYCVPENMKHILDSVLRSNGVDA